jgi:hypothetical protein
MPLRPQQRMQLGYARAAFAGLQALAGIDRQRARCVQLRALRRKRPRKAP